jgi:hypothetical protein
MLPKRAVSMNGKVFLYIQEGVITLLSFLCCQPVLEKGLEIFGHDQEVRSIGTIHYFYDYVL